MLEPACNLYIYSRKTQVFTSEKNVQNNFRKIIIICVIDNRMTSVVQVTPLPLTKRVIEVKIKKENLSVQIFICVRSSFLIRTGKQGMVDVQH